MKTPKHTNKSFKENLALLDDNGMQWKDKGVFPHPYIMMADVTPDVLYMESNGRIGYGEFPFGSWDGVDVIAWHWLEDIPKSMRVLRLNEQADIEIKTDGPSLINRIIPIIDQISLLWLKKKTPPTPGS